MTKDQEQLKQLSVSHLVLGILTSLGSCVFLIDVTIGIAALNGKFDDNGLPTPPEFGWLFLIMGSLAFLACLSISILSIIASKKLKAHKSRIFCLVVAGIECLNMPLGTVLGIFTIILLTKEPVIQLFAGQPLPESQQQSGQPGPSIPG